MADKYMVVLYKQYADGMFWARIGEAKSSQDGTKQDWPTFEFMAKKLNEQEKRIEELQEQALCNEQRECNACDWRGIRSDCTWLGAVGPLCPLCYETTDEAPNDPAKGRD
jgi:hypothetical protein